MLRSRSNALVAVRRVTELNAGRKTAGVDGKVVVAAEQKAELVDWLQHRTRTVVAAPGQAGVCAQEQRAPSPARNPRDRRQVSSGPDGERVGARVVVSTNVGGRPRG